MCDIEDINQELNFLRIGGVAVDSVDGWGFLHTVQLHMYHAQLCHFSMAELLLFLFT